MIPHLTLDLRLKAKVKPIKNEGMSTFIVFICFLNVLATYIRNGGGEKKTPLTEPKFAQKPWNSETSRIKEKKKYLSH